MALSLYNTLTKRKEEFKPIGDEVKIYNCGMTVYDVNHIGHARNAIVFDVLVRWLRASGLRVRYVTNFTDVDDKTINRAKELGVPLQQLTNSLIERCLREFDELGIERADVYPRATQHISEIVELITRLIEKGFAYVVDGDVFFEVAKWKKYGELSGQSISALMAGARIEVDARKRAPEDFTLWKAQKPGEPAWSAPWSSGRPGWHIECSAMIHKHLGKTIDIHGGGQDLIFPHHECECAQSEAANDAPLARFWLHNGLLTIDGQKMSKSLKNFITLEEALKRYGADCLRYWFLKTHWHEPIDYSPGKVEAMREEVQRLYDFVDNLELAAEEAQEGEAGTGLLAEIERCREAFKAAMDDNLNTPRAIAALHRLRDVGNAYLARGNVTFGGVEVLKKAFSEMCSVFGLLLKERRVELPMPRGEIELLLKQREAARAVGDYATSDAIRAQLRARGVIVEDTPKGPRWRLARA